MIPLVSYAWHDVVLPDTKSRNATTAPELHTLPAEVSFTHGLSHVLNIKSKEIILP